MDAAAALGRRVVGPLLKKPTPEAPKLEVLYEAAGDKEAIDIVVVHGFARGFKSWTWHDRKGTSWLADPFSQDIAKRGFNARVMSFSYNPEALGQQFLVRKAVYGLALDLVQHLRAKRLDTNTPSRPLIFIAHSLGGLIVKRALIISFETEDLRDIELSTGGVTFLGTPDTSIAAESLEDIIQKVAKLSPLYRALRGDESQCLRNDAQWLKQEFGAFLPISAGISINSFFEQKQTTFLRGTFHSGVVVNEEFVQKPSLPPAGKHGLNKTHTGLIRFDGEADTGYKIFLHSFTREILENATRNANNKWDRHSLEAEVIKGKRNSFSMSGDIGVPSRMPEGPKHFYRDRLVTQLEAQLSDDADAGRVAIVTVSGRRGVGKTTLVRSCCQRATRSGRFVFWFDAESRETLVTGFLELAQHILNYYWRKYYANEKDNTDKARAHLRAELGLPDVERLLQAKDFDLLDAIKVRSAVRAVKDWLLREGNRWLLVYKNVEGDANRSFDLLEFLPLTVQGQIILITQGENRSPWSTSELVVSEWSEEESVGLLQELSGGETSGETGDDRYPHAARMITEALRRDPLAISCAAAHIRAHRPNMTLATYWDGLSNQIVSLQNSSEIQSELGRKILRMSAMLSVQAIPVEIFLWGHPGPVQHGEQRSVLSVVHHLDNEKIVQVVPRKESDPTQDETEHQPILLFENARNWIMSHLLGGRQEISENARLVCSYCVRAIKRQHDMDGPANFLRGIQSFGRAMLPHAKACYDMRDLLSHDARSKIEWHVLGNLCRSQGAISTAIGCLELAMGQAKSELTRTLTALSLAAIYYDKHDSQSCRGVLSRIDILGNPKGIPGGRAWVKNDLDFRLLFAQAEVAALESNHLVQAAAQFKQIERTQTENAGPADPKALLAGHRLAATLVALGDFDRATMLYDRVYKSYCMQYGHGSPLALEAAEELAHVVELRGDFDEAERLYRETIEVKSATLGEEHPSTAVSQARLASVLDQNANYEAASEIYEKALTTLKRRLGGSHPSYAAALENQALGFVARASFEDQKYRRQELLNGAEKLLLEVIDIKSKHRELFPKDSVDESRKNLVLLRREAKE